MPSGILVWTDVWSVPPVEVQPRVLLTHWRLVEVSEPGVDDGVTLHAVGYCALRGEGRVTSPVTRMDRGVNCVLSSKGRVYQLEGAPGNHPDAEHVLNRWLRLNAATVLRDVSEDFLQGAPRMPRCEAVTELTPPSSSVAPDRPPGEPVE